MEHSQNVINQIKLPNNSIYDIHDAKAVHEIAPGNLIEVSPVVDEEDNQIGYQIEHESITTSSSTETAQSPGYGGTFNVVSGLTVEDGHIKTIKTKNITMPSEQNIPSLSGGRAIASDATVIGGITVSGHEVTASPKTISSGAKIHINGNASAITIAHTTTSTSGTTSTSSPGFGGSFTAIDGVELDTTGHLTRINTKTITLPTIKATDIPEIKYSIPSGTTFPSDRKEGDVFLLLES